MVKLIKRVKTGAFQAPSSKPNNACSQRTAHFKNFVSSRNVRDDTTNIFKSCVTTEPFRLLLAY